MLKLFQYELKKLTSRRITWLVLIAGAAIAVAALAEVLFNKPWIEDARTILSPAEAAMNRGGSGFGKFAILLYVPLAAALPCADTYLRECKNRSAALLVAKAGVARYYWSKAAAVMLFSAVIAMLPFLFNQALCLAALPRHALLPDGSVYYMVSFAYDSAYALFPGLYFNSPTLDALAHTGLAGLLGMALGLCAYAVTLFYRKNAFIALAGPTVATFAACLLLNSSGYDWLVVYDYLQTVTMPSTRSIYPYLAFVGVLLAIGLGAVLYKVKKGRDFLL